MPRRISASPAPNSENQPLLENEAQPEIEPSGPIESTYYVFYRSGLLVLLALAIIWLLLLVVDMFVSVGLDSVLGSGFENLYFTLISIASFVLSIMFYKVPSPMDELFAKITAGLLAIDMIIVLTVEHLRRQLGPFTMCITFGGAIVSFLLGAYSNEFVYWNKRAARDQAVAESNLRRNETVTVGGFRQRMLAFLDSTARLLLMAIVLVASIGLCIDGIDGQLTPLGDIVTVGSELNGRWYAPRIHVACTPAGKEGPVVIAEAGETSAEEFSTWVLAAEKIKMVCYWDRPGYGFSENAPSPSNMATITSFLSAGLEEVLPSFRNESLVLVAHGVGGLYARVFAAQHPEQIAGIMLVDALHEEQFYRGTAWYTGLGHFIKGLWDAAGVNKILGVIFGQNSEDRIYGLFEGQETRLQKSLLQQQVSASRRSKLDIDLATSSLPRDTPLLVVSAKDHKNRQWFQYQRRLLKLTDDVLAWKLLEGPHAIWRNKRSARELAKLLTYFVRYGADPPTDPPLLEE